VGELAFVGFCARLHACSHPVGGDNELAVVACRPELTISVVLFALVKESGLDFHKNLQKSSFQTQAHVDDR